MLRNIRKSRVFSAVASAIGAMLGGRPRTDSRGVYVPVFQEEEKPRRPRRAYVPRRELSELAFARTVAITTPVRRVITGRFARKLLRRHGFRRLDLRHALKTLRQVGQVAA